MIAEGRAGGDSRAAHGAIVDRLHENQQLAEAQGWTRCRLERFWGGRLALWGMPPRASDRVEVPDLRRGA